MSVPNLADQGTLGTQGDSFASRVAISADSRYVAFNSDATNIVLSDTNGTRDTFVHDRMNGLTERVSVDSSGTQSTASVAGPIDISADGRYVAFFSLDNMLAPPFAGCNCVYVRDRNTGTTYRADSNSGGSGGPSLSDSGLRIAFEQYFVDLAPGDNNGLVDVYVRDWSAPFALTLASVATTGFSGNGQSYYPAISGNGQFVAFYSQASNLVTGDTNGVADIFVRDLVAGTTERMSVPDGMGGEADGESREPSISADGRFVAFGSFATNLVSPPTSGALHVFVRDRVMNTTTLISVGSVSSNHTPAISGNGRYVSWETNGIAPPSPNCASDIYIRDRVTNITALVDSNSSGQRAVCGTSGNYSPTVDSSGRYIAFESWATNLAPDDTNGTLDIYLRDLADTNGNGEWEPFDPDDDSDGVPDVSDNCADLANAAQTNSDSGPPPPAGNTGEIDNGSGIAAADRTTPNGDGVGDLCDPDDDNDLADDTGVGGGIELCQIYAGPNVGVYHTLINTDITNLVAAAGDPTSWDSDGDGVRDGVECNKGTIPSADNGFTQSQAKASRPSVTACGGSGDADGDGLPASAENCAWGTSDVALDSDGDGIKDCVEANDTNGDGFQTFPVDTINSAKAANNIIQKTIDFDLNGDGAVNFPGDTILSAKTVNHVGGICM